MSNNNDNKNIQFTGDPVAFDGVEGKRDPKVGKGRFDLIPTEVYHPLFKMAARNWLIDCNPASIMTSIADELFLKAIIQMTVYSYLDTTKIDGGVISTTAFWRCVWPMLQDLAIHFQKGAEHYGERNCQKGIPLWSFKDSAMRHAAQTFEGKEDEPHKISVIWNLWMAQWTVIQERKKTVDAISGPPMTLYEMNKDWCNPPTNKEQTPREKAKAFMTDYLDELKADLTAIIKSLKDSRADLKSQQFKYTSDSMEYINIHQSVADLKRIIKGLQCVADHVGIPIVTVEQKPDDKMDEIIKEMGENAREAGIPWPPKEPGVVPENKPTPKQESVKVVMSEEYDCKDRVTTFNGRKMTLSEWLFDCKNHDRMLIYLKPNELLRELIIRVSNDQGLGQDYRDYAALFEKLHSEFKKYMMLHKDKKTVKVTLSADNIDEGAEFAKWPFTTKEVLDEAIARLNGISIQEYSVKKKLADNCKSEIQELRKLVEVIDKDVFDKAGTCCNYSTLPRTISMDVLLREILQRLDLINCNTKPVKQAFVSKYQDTMTKITQRMDAIKRGAVGPIDLPTPKHGVLPPSAAAKYVLVQDKYADIREEIKRENSVGEETSEPAKDTAMEEFNKAITTAPVERLLGELTEELSDELQLCQSSPTFANAWQFVHKYRESLNKMLEVWNQIAAAAYDPKPGDKHSDDK